MLATMSSPPRVPSMVDHGSVKMRIAEFDKRNGSNPVLMGGWWWYANGAVRELEPLGALIDPPRDEYDRLRNILRYHQARLNHAVRDFDNFKDQLMMSRCNDGPGLDRLKALQITVSERNQAVEEAKARLAATERGQAMEGARRQDAESRAEQDQFRDAVKQIRI